MTERYYSPELSPAEQVREFNNTALELSGMLAGDAQRLEVRIGQTGEGKCKVEFEPMEWERVDGEMGSQKKRKKEKEKGMVEDSAVGGSAVHTKVIEHDPSSVLNTDSLVLVFSSNRNLAETPRSSLLTDLVRLRNGTKDAPEKVLDLWVSTRDGIMEKSDFQVYHTAFTQKESRVKELGEITDLLKEVVEGLGGLSESDEGGEA